MNLSPDARRGLEDLFFFLVTYWHLDLEEKPHREMCETLQATEDNPETPFAMLVVPRGTYKTSIARGGLVWKQLRRIFLYDDPYYRIVLASATLDLSRKSLGLIETRLRDNPILTDAYGELWRNRTNNNQGSRTPDGIFLAPRLDAQRFSNVVEPSFWVGSLRRISTGFHADAGFVDDLNNEDNITTVHQREKVHRYWGDLFSIISSERGANPPIWFLCTAYHDDDVRGRIAREEKARCEEEVGYASQWNILHRDCGLESGDPYFPRKYPLDRLLTIKGKIGSRAFAAQYMGDPVTKESAIATEDQVRFKAREEFPPMKRMRITVDPNQHNDAKEAGCYAAIVVAGYDRFANLYIHDIRASREWNSGQFIDELFDLQATYPSVDMFMEDSHMTHFEHSIRMEQEKRNAEGDPVRLRLHFFPSDRSLSKYDRIFRIQPRFERGQIFFADEIAPSLKLELKDELVRGKASRFSDLIDAVAMAETGIKPKIDRTGQPVEPHVQKVDQGWREPSFSDVLPAMRRYEKGPN